MKEILEYNKKLSKIKYGWHDKNNKVHTTLRGGDFVKNYRMQDINDDINYAICWELVELERIYFEKHAIPYFAVNAMIKIGHKYPCHTFLVFIKNKKFYWFESSWDKMKGVREYNSLESIFDEVRNNFEEFTKTPNYDSAKIKFYSYKKPHKNIKCNPFYYHILLFGKRIG